MGNPLLASIRSAASKRDERLGQSSHEVTAIHQQQAKSKPRPAFAAAQSNAADTTPSRPPMGNPLLASIRNAASKRDERLRKSPHEVSAVNATQLSPNPDDQHRRTTTHLLDLPWAIPCWCRFAMPPKSENNEWLHLQLEPVAMWHQNHEGT